MTYVIPISVGEPSQRAVLDRHGDIKWFADVGGGNFHYGPQARLIVQLMGSSQLLGRSPILADGVTSSTADAFTQGRTFFVLDPKSVDFGIWGANAVGQEDIDYAIKNGVPFSTSYLKRLYANMPDAAALVQMMNDTKIGGFGNANSSGTGFLDDLKTYQPTLYASVQSAMGIPTIPTQRARPKIGPTVELTLLDDDNFFFAKNAGEDTDPDPDNGSPHPDLKTVGPGMWETLIGVVSPKSKGLPRPIVTYSESDGMVYPASERGDGVDVYQVALTRAAQGDKGAIEALRGIGEKPPQVTGSTGGNGFMEELHRLFG